MKSNSSWFGYWNQKDTSMLESMRKNREIFLRNSKTLFAFNKKDVVLDIGGGPGYLEDYLRNKVKEIYCLETSDYFLDILNKKFNQSPNVNIYRLSKSNYTNFNFLNSKKFTKVLCIGVVPYYKSVSEFERLIKEVKTRCKDGLLLIADIKVKDSLWDDVLGLFKMGIKEKYLINPLLFLAKARFSSYHKAFKKRGLLVIPEETIKSILKRLNLNGEIIDLPLSINSQRKHLLIRF